MLSALVRSWWILVLRGLFAVLFGVLGLLWPGITVAVLVILFGVYAFADGSFAIVMAAQHRGRWWALLLEGLVGIAAGVSAFLWPAITALTLLYLIAGWAIATGVFEIIAAIRLRKLIEGEVLLALSGIASIVFGVLIMIWPGAGALAVVTMIAVYSLLFGILLIALGVRLRSMKTPGPPAAANTIQVAT